MTRVLYVTGRRKALARGIALEMAKEEGRNWSRMTPSEIRCAVAKADRVLQTLVDNEVLAEFIYDWRG